MNFNQMERMLFVRNPEYGRGGSKRPKDYSSTKKKRRPYWQYSRYDSSDFDWLDKSIKDQYNIETDDSGDVIFTRKQPRLNSMDSWFKEFDKIMDEAFPDTDLKKDKISEDVKKRVGNLDPVINELGVLIDALGSILDEAFETSKKSPLSSEAESDPDDNRPVIDSRVWTGDLKPK